MCKNSIWDLINSTINRRDERDKRDVFFLVSVNYFITNLLAVVLKVVLFYVFRLYYVIYSVFHMYFTFCHYRHVTLKDKTNDSS